MPSSSILIRGNLAAWLCLVVAATLGQPAWAAPKESKSSGAEQVTLVWCCTGPCDVYLNGKPLRDAKPDFMSRDEEGGEEYTAKASLKVGDVITVGARRGKQCGFRLAAFDGKDRLVWQTDTVNWRAYEIGNPRSAKRWYMPATVLHTKLKPVAVPANEFPPLVQFEKPRADVADHIWYQDANVVFLAAKITARRNLAPLPMESTWKNGKVQWFVNEEQLDGLQPDDLTDGKIRTKRFQGSTMRYSLEFLPPVEFQGATVSLADPPASYTWQIECADHRRDLIDKTGTYRTVTKSRTTTAADAVDIYWSPTKASWWQLTVHSVGGKNSVGLRKFELLAPLQ